MTIKTAVILAAGLGSRLKQLGIMAPKGFLQLGEQPIIEESLAHLRAAGIDDVVIITGHLAEFYQQLQSKHADLIRLVHNPEYQRYGSMYSLYCARHVVQTDFVLLESDIIYQRRGLLACLQDPRDNLMLLSGATHSGDEVYVEAPDQVLRAVSKQRAELSTAIAGELVGIIKMNQAFYQAMCASYAQCLQQKPQLSYEMDCLVSVAQALPMHTLLVDDLLWAEIDDEQHLARARGLYNRIAC